MTIQQFIKKEILRMISERKTISEIAISLGISERTLARYQHNFNIRIPRKNSSLFKNNFRGKKL